MRTKCFDGGKGPHLKLYSTWQLNPIERQMAFCTVAMARAHISRAIVIVCILWSVTIAASASALIQFCTVFVPSVSVWCRFSERLYTLPVSGIYSVPTSRLMRCIRCPMPEWRLWNRLPSSLTAWSLPTIGMDQQAYTKKIIKRPRWWQQKVLNFDVSNVS